jgi:hypothetical protein
LRRLDLLIGHDDAFAFPSSMYLQAAFAARRPSVNEPDENACGVPPTASPAPNRPSIVVMRL